MASGPFATPEDLEARWRPLTPVEREQAVVLLEDASQLVIDEGCDVSRVAEATLRRVVCGVVKRAMGSAGDFGVTSLQQGAGPYQQTMQYSNPLGDLYLTKADRRALGCAGQRAFEIDLLPEVSP